MRIVLVTGKGGVGKSTTAAATALRLAERGLKTLAVCAGAAHSLGDTFGQAVGNEPSEVAPGLSAVQVDTQQCVEDAWGGLWGGLERHVPGLLDRGVDPVTADELTVLPGIEELVVLLTLARYARTGDWDVLVVDCPAASQTLRMLALPEALGWYVAKAFPAQRAAARGSRPLAVLLALHDELAAVRRLFGDPAVTTVRLVVSPEAVAVAETRRVFTALALYGYAVDAVVANRVVPPGGDAWRAGWAAAQQVQLAEIRASFPAVRIGEVAYRGAEPVGAAALREVADELYGVLPGLDPAAPIADPRLLSVRPDGADFVFELALPLAGSDGVEASRAGDELVVTVGGHRRVLALPSVLRRCTVVGGRVRDGTLQLRFRRDPALWRMDGPV